MSFQSLSFLAFLAVTLGVCLPLGRRNLRWGQAALTLFCLVAAGRRFWCCWQGPR